MSEQIIEPTAWQAKEAFCLMWYACRSKHCRCRIRIWNSRNGVTPFGLPCPSCGSDMVHVDWFLDVAAPDHQLRHGQHFWRDGTPEEAVAIMRGRIESSRGKPYATPPDREALLLDMAAHAHELLDTDMHEFRKGWPMLDCYNSVAAAIARSTESTA